MKDEQHKNIDDVFRQGINDPVNEPEYRQDHWDALDEMLTGKKKPGKMVYWLPIMGAAAMMLVALGWWYLTPHAEQNANFAQHVVIKKKVDGLGTARQGNVLKPSKTIPQISQDKRTGDLGTVSATALKQSSYEHNNKTAYPLNFVNVKSGTKEIDQNDTNANFINPGKMNKVIVLLDQPKQTSLRTGNAIANLAPPTLMTPTVTIAAVGTSAQWDKDADEKALFKNPRFAVTVLASTDVNGLNSFSTGNAGQNLGMLFSARFNKLSISTGAYYSFKPYTVPFSSYNPASTYRFRHSPESVTADCRMLDIPLNIDYQIFAKNKNAISVGTGISSFVMLKESYKYNYANAAAYGSSSYIVKNPDKYLFSSLNFQANYRRQINSKIGLNVMPYVKIPLNDIGYSRVKLQTMGVAVGLNWNLNSLTKPK